MYHEDPDRLFYNTGNRKNTNKRCGLSNCHQDEENYSEDSDSNISNAKSQFQILKIFSDQISKTEKR
jgi:hypothetical protein